MLEFESDVIATRVVNTSHNLAYSHSQERKLLESNTEALKARIRAVSWHKEVCVEYGIKCRIDDELSNVHSLNHHAPHDVAAAIHEPGCVDGWLIQDVHLI